MKKAPKRYRKGYFEGGETVEDNPNKPLGKKLTPAEWDALNKTHGNVVYPYSSGLSTGHKTYYDPNQWKVTKDETDPTKVYSEYIGKEKKDLGDYPQVELYDYEYKATPKPKSTSAPMIYGNYQDGKQVPYQGKPVAKAKGGIVMKKAPCRMKKGGTC